MRRLKGSAAFSSSREGEDYAIAKDWSSKTRDQDRHLRREERIKENQARVPPVAAALRALSAGSVFQMARVAELATDEGGGRESGEFTARDPVVQVARNLVCKPALRLSSTDLDDMLLPELQMVLMILESPFESRCMVLGEAVWRGGESGGVGRVAGPCGGLLGVGSAGAEEVRGVVLWWLCRGAEERSGGVSLV